MKTLIFPAKKIRAQAIKDYIGKNIKVVCFTCGNASKALREEGLEVLSIGEHEDFKPNKWYTPKEIKHIFPEYFDATSGHLPIDLMLDISQRFKNYLGTLKNEPISVPTGSGETIICLKLAYPEIKFIPVYNLDEATEYNEKAPLNKIVEIFCN